MSAQVRDPSAAVEHLEEYEARLELSEQALEERAEIFGDAPETLFRATPALFVDDLRGPFADAAALFVRKAPKITVLGDAHLGNFGVVEGPSSDPVYAPNDFDQSGVASPELDLARMAASARLIARALKVPESATSRIVQAFVLRYFDALASREPPLPPFLTAGEVRGPVARRLEKAAQMTRAGLLKKWNVQDEDGLRRFAREGELEPLPLVEESFVRGALKTYGEQLRPGGGVRLPLEVLDVVGKRGSGTSSRGLPRYFALVEGPAPAEPPVILDVKALLPIAVDRMEGARGDPAVVVARQEAIGALFDPLTAAVVHEGVGLLVRERPPRKKNVKLKHLSDEADLEALVAQAAEVLARAHARTPDQAAALLTWIGGELARGAERLDAFSTLYADQVEVDFAAVRGS